MLKAGGYATGQFGKNHLGDRNEFLPTVHGFDEWFGNLYHLNAEEEPEELDYPGQKNPEYKAKFGPRGVLHAWATDKDDPTETRSSAGSASRRSRTPAPLTRKRMETFDGEVLDKTLDWLDRTAKTDKPFFCWFNTTAIHIWSHPPKKYIQKAVDEGRAENDVVRAKMIEHDEQVGVLLKKLKDLGVDDNTIVVYTTDNGNELMMWPDGGYAPFRGEKGTTWEGGVRVPLPDQVAGQDPAGQRLQRHPEPRRPVRHAGRGGGHAQPEGGAAEGLQGANGTTYKVHLDGYNNLDHWTGESAKSARREFFYYDETDLMAVRVDGWKMHIGVKTEGSWWNEKYYPSVPYLFNLLMDPMEKMDPGVATSGATSARKFFAARNCGRRHAAGPFLATHLKSIVDFPPIAGRGLAEHEEDTSRWR